MKFLLSNLIFYTICLFLAKQSFAQENISIIDSMLTEIITEEIIESVSDNGDTLSVTGTSSDDDLFRYGMVFISNHLRRAGFIVYRPQSIQSVTPGMIIEISRISVIISYSEAHSSGIIGTDYSNRTIHLQMTGQILDSNTGELIKMVDAVKIYQDEIKYNEIEELEGVTYSFTQGERKKYTSWDRFIEPALVISSVVIIVLLFFTQRA